MAKILIPTPLRQFADKKDSEQLTGSTVGEVLKSLTSEYTDLRRHLYNDEGKLRSFVNVYVNDEDIRYLNKEATPLADVATFYDNSQRAGPREVALFANGFPIGTTDWPTWTPDVLVQRWPRGDE